jgi:hypothetical protein
MFDKQDITSLIAIVNILKKKPYRHYPIDKEEDAYDRGYNKALNDIISTLEEVIEYIDTDELIKEDTNKSLKKL